MWVRLSPANEANMPCRRGPLDPVRASKPCPDFSAPRARSAEALRSARNQSPATEKTSSPSLENPGLKIREIRRSGGPKTSIFSEADFGFSGLATVMRIPARNPQIVPLSGQAGWSKTVQVSEADFGFNFSRKSLGGVESKIARGVAPEMAEGSERKVLEGSAQNWLGGGDEKWCFWVDLGTGFGIN